MSGSTDDEALTGPRVVAVGGGHGLAASLRAIRHYTSEVTAVVSVADDGGSTGRIRAVEDLPAPGDLRTCLVALSDPESLLTRTMEYRFDGGELDGHALGNLLIVAASATAGNLVAALDAVGDLTGAVGRVLPATTTAVHLRASAVGGDVVMGQVSVAERSDICTVGVDPEDAPACAEAVAAIASADQIVLGPGSLYTSVLAATAVRGIRQAIVDSPAQLVYVCNLRPQDGETVGYDVGAHVAALGRHGLVPDVVLHDPDTIPSREDVPSAVPATVAAPSGRAHDPALLGAALESLYVGRGAPEGR